MIHSWRKFCLALLLLPAVCWSNLKPWPQVGSARLEVLWFDIYDAELFSPSGTYQVDAPMLLKLTYLRDFKAKELVEETENQWQGKVNQASSKLWLAQIAEFWPDIEKGQTLSFIIDEQGFGQFYFENEFIGKIEDSQFSQNFIDIWLAKDSDYPKLAAQLRGEAHD